MKVVCPFAQLNPATKIALGEYETEFVDVSVGELAYFELMRRLWTAGETCVVVEHDIVPWPGALNQLFECPQELCFFPVPLFLRDGALMFSRGPVVKYSATLMAKFPDQVDQVQDKHWRNLVEGLLVPLERKVIPHEHNPPVSHIKPLEEWDSYCERLRTAP